METSKNGRRDAALKPSRREMLNYMWMGSVALLSIQTTGLGIYYSLPRLKEGEFGGRFKVGRIVDLPSPGDPPRNVPSGKFWLVRTEDHLLAIYKACTHLDCMFDWNPQEGKFICPCHGSLFTRDGRLLRGPAPRSLDQFAIQIVSTGGETLAQTDAHKGLLMPPVAGVGGASEPADGSKPANPPPAGDLVPPDALVWVDTGHKIRAVEQTG